MSKILFLTTDSQATIALEYQRTILIRKQGKILDCYLETTSSRPDYQIIEDKQLFNLIPEIKSPLFKDKFLENHPLFIKIKIKKKLLPNLLIKSNQEQEIGQYLIEISENLTDKIKQDNDENTNPILMANNWYCLELKQILENKNIGYQTLWNEIDLGLDLSPEQKSNNISKQFNAWVDEQASAEWEEATNKIENFFDDLITKIDENIENTKEEDKKSKSISEIVKDFLLEDNWNYLQLNDGITMQMTCQCERGQISCYARNLDEENQFIFYSLFPEAVPENQRLAMAELITKINYGMIVGNLEMDFEDGELRYKTSIDVEGDRLSTALVKRLVYANVLTMDKYLPAITAILNQECSIDEAIAQVET